MMGVSNSIYSTGILSDCVVLLTIPKVPATDITAKITKYFIFSPFVSWVIIPLKTKRIIYFLSLDFLILNAILELAEFTCFLVGSSIISPSRVILNCPVISSINSANS